MSVDLGAQGCECGFELRSDGAVMAGAGRGLHGASPQCRLRVLAWRGRAVHIVAVNPAHRLVAA